jgi:hypothetical protein
MHTAVQYPCPPLTAAVLEEPEEGEEGEGTEKTEEGVHPDILCLVNGLGADKVKKAQ